jgi:hypothetical protein
VVVEESGKVKGVMLWNGKGAVTPGEMGHILELVVRFGVQRYSYCFVFVLCVYEDETRHHHVLAMSYRNVVGN